MGLERIDKNFSVDTQRKDGMVDYRIPCALFDLYGIFYGEHDDNRFFRFPSSIANKVSGAIGWGNRYPSGGRLRFRTNAKRLELTVRADSEDGDVPLRMTALMHSGFVLCEDCEKGEIFRGCLISKSEKVGNFHVAANLSPNAQWKDYILYFPLYNDVKEVTVSLPQDAELEKPKKYRDVKPILYYGSSITHGGTASRPDSCYPALISKWNKIDFINLGFSGSALGEQEMANYLASVDCSLFVCDYDHNAPNAEHLKATHYRLYETFRSKQKETPILFLTKPDVRRDVNGKARRDVIYNTYKTAKSAGDKNVYFLDGKTFFGDKDSELCTIDGCHPNDLGFYKMAKKIYAKMITIDKRFE